jgi:acyl-CoA thioesterase FadM
MSYYELHCKGTKCADGAAKIVSIDLATGRSTPLPDVLLAPLRAAAE